MTESPSQIVYVLTNPAMLGLVKIGKTTQLEVEDRIKQLFSTGLPVPFDCAFACQVKDAAEVERALHMAFGDHRINPNREFFKIEAERVIAVLKLLKVEDITAQLEQTLEADVTAATRKLLGLPHDYPLQPSPHWTFNGQSLKALYEAVHDGGE